MAYRYRTTTALFPLVPPPPRPVYPRGAVIRRFAIGAILVAVFVFVLFFLLGAFLGASAGKTVGYALIAALVCAAPVSVCGVVLARLQCCRNLRGLLLAAPAGALSWCGIVICGV